VDKEEEREVRLALSLVCRELEMALRRKEEN
jgi:DNA topoisomerase VI subunit B